MEDNIITAIAAYIKEYLDSEKHITINENRKSELVQALSAAHRIFPDATISIKGDPLQLGSVIISIKDFDIDIPGGGIPAYSEMTAAADNFTIYPTSNHMLKLDIMFNDVLNIIEIT